MKTAVLENSGSIFVVDGCFKSGLYIKILRILRFRCQIWRKLKCWDWNDQNMVVW